MLPVGNRLDFSDWLQSEMDKRQWSQSNLARASNLNRAVINKLLNRKSNPHPETLMALARAFKIPVEAAYRAAGLLPEIPEAEEFLEDLIHKFRLIQTPQRKMTAVSLLQALIREEENEQRSSQIPGK